MKTRPCYFREYAQYSFDTIREKFGRSEAETKAILRNLKQRGIVKAVAKSTSVKEADVISLTDDLTDNVDGGSTRYVFVFVGIIVYQGLLIKCYPKYLPDDDPGKDAAVQLAVKVSKRAGACVGSVSVADCFDEGSVPDWISLALFFLLDYYEYGLYSNTKKVTEQNGNGEILWNRTVNETRMFLIDGSPFYPEMLTQRRLSDEYSYIQRLHAYAITLLSKNLEDCGLLDCFDLSSVELSYEAREDFGEPDEICDRICKELNVQFNTRKQTVLKALRFFFSEDYAAAEANELTLCGTNIFYHVWEVMCAEVLDNKLHTPLKGLRLPKDLRKTSFADKADMSLLDLIEKPYWSYASRFAKDTLIPDAITFRTASREFFIFDAKYYTPTLEPERPPSGQPGIESVTKQYLYQLAYKSFIEELGFKHVYNCFLLPTEKEDVLDRGDVSLKILSQFCLSSIQVRLLPVMRISEYYLSGKTLDLSELKLPEIVSDDRAERSLQMN